MSGQDTSSTKTPGAARGSNRQDPEQDPEQDAGRDAGHADAANAISSGQNVDTLVDRARAGVSTFLDQALREGRIDPQLHAEAWESTIPNLESWLRSPHLARISPNAHTGIANAIDAADWEGIINAFRRHLSFGTGGIRGMMAFDIDSIKALLEHESGLDAPILKGPSTLNNVVILRVSAGVARFGRDKGFSKIVIGYDSRVRGGDFARIIAELFLHFGFTVYMFDEPCPYPEVTFAIPCGEIEADMGILISASHNDYRYNGYKLCSANGSQFDATARDEMYNEYITKATFDDVQWMELEQAPPGRLLWLGGAEPLPDVEYMGHPILNVHDLHRDHIQGLLVDADRFRTQSASREALRVGFCPFHGAGRKAVPRLLASVGCTCQSTTSDGLSELNGLFPAFSSEKGKEQQPDPGDPRAAKIAVSAFERDFPGELDDTDIIIGTDPDADRCGVIVQVPPDQRHLYGGDKTYLLPADDMWTLILWFRLQSEIEKHGQVVAPETKFIVQSMPTTDATVRLARKHGLGSIRTWVGFANLAAATLQVWDKTPLPALVRGRRSPDDMLCDPFICEHDGMDTTTRSFNYCAMEQSNGFSILGGPPPNDRSMGTDGHVRDKDGTFAAILIAELAAHLKTRGTSLYEAVDKEIYLDPDIGLFVNHYEPDPLDGEYPGIQGDRKKKQILQRALAYFNFAKAGDLELGPFKVTNATIYRTGKYDHVYAPTCEFQFPDEGLQFDLGDGEYDRLLIRPSGTGNSMRFHIQLHADVDEASLIEKKATLRKQVLEVMDDVREKLGALRGG